MAYKDILAHVDTLEPSAARLASAIALAEALDARLTGIYVKSKPYLPAYAEVQIGAEVLEAHARELERIAKGAEGTFAAATKASAVKTDWRVVEGDTPEVLASHARYFDLTVVGQGDPGDNLFIGDRVMPDRMILSAGRPVLVV
ncbi:MAG: universal stress protein, partial [Rhodospirillales bacterium]